MKENPFKNYQPEDAAIILEQSLAPDGTTMIRCQLEGKGSDIVHMLAMTLKADSKEGGLLRQMLSDAMEIGLDVETAQIQLKIQTGEEKKEVIN